MEVVEEDIICLILTTWHCVAVHTETKVNIDASHSVTIADGDEPIDDTHGLVHAKVVVVGVLSGMASHETPSSSAVEDAL